jgi:hypothetical protein
LGRYEASIDPAVAKGDAGPANFIDRAALLRSVAPCVKSLYFYSGFVRDFEWAELKRRVAQAAAPGRWYTVNIGRLERPQQFQMLETKVL